MAILPILDLGSLWVNDVPLGETRADFVDETGNVVQITDYSSWSAEMITPSNTLAGSLTGSEHGQHLEFPWPEDSILLEPGIFTISIKFYDALGVAVTCEPWRFVVQESTGWLTLEQARQRWADAPLDDVTLYSILDTAKAQVIAYAPALALGETVPATYVEGQILQSRAIYMAGAVNSAENLGVGDYQTRVFPLDWNIRALLRPKRAIGGMF